MIMDEIILSKPTQFFLLNDSGYTFLEGIDFDELEIIVDGRRDPKFNDLIFVTTKDLERSVGIIIKDSKPEFMWAFIDGVNVKEITPRRNRDVDNMTQKIILASLRHKR